MVPSSSKHPEPEPDPDSPSPPTGSAGLQRRMAEELDLRGYARRTRKVYLGHVRRFLTFIDTDPRDHPRECYRRFLLHLLNDRKLSRSYVSQAVSALKLFYRHVLELDGVAVDLPRPRVERKLPVVLSTEEVGRLLEVVENPKHRAILMTVYAAGLRVGEVVRLRPDDIDSDRMLIHVRQGKGRKDRYVMRSEIALHALREYWKLDEPGKWLFPGARVGRRLTERSLQKVFKRAARWAGIRKDARSTGCGTPSPRTCWRPEPTSDSSRSCWATRARRPRKFTRRSPGGALDGSGARSTAWAKSGAWAMTGPAGVGGVQTGTVSRRAGERARS